MVVESFPDTKPEWARGSEEYTNWIKINERFYRHYLGTSSDIAAWERRTACESADADTKKQISEEIVSKVVGKYIEEASRLKITSELLVNEQIRKKTDRKLAKDTLSNLVGTETSGKYWERRDYTNSGGKKKHFTCYIFLRIHKLAYLKLINKVSKKLLGSIKSEGQRKKMEHVFKSNEDLLEIAKKK